MSEPRIDAEFHALIPPLQAEELEQLEANLAAHGCLDPLIVWKGESILLDGHNRLDICKRRKLEYKTRELALPDRDTAKRWIIQNQFGRRNLTPYQKAELALKLKPILEAQAKQRQGTRTDLGRNLVPISAQGSKTRDKVAKLAGVSHDTIAKAEYIEEHADEAAPAVPTIGEADLSWAQPSPEIRRKFHNREETRQAGWCLSRHHRQSGVHRGARRRSRIYGTGLVRLEPKTLMGEPDAPPLGAYQIRLSLPPFVFTHLTPT